MNKTDFVSGLGLFGSLLYFIFLLLLFVIVTKRSLTKEYVVGFTLVFGFYYLIFVMNHVFDILPFYPDTRMFNAMIVDNYVPEMQSKGVHAYFALMQPLYFISMRSYGAFVVLTMFFSMLSFVLIWFAFLNFSKYRNVTITKRVFWGYVLMLCIYPSGLLFLTVPLREWLTLLGFSLLIYSLSLIITKQRYATLFFILASVVIILPRPIMAILPLMSLVVILGAIRTKIVGVIVSIILVPIIFETFTHYKFNPSFFSYLRNSANTTYESSGMVYGIVNWQSYFDILIDLPKLWLQFLLSPLPILHNVNPLRMTAHLVDSVVVFFIVLFLLMNWKRYFEVFVLFVGFSLLFAIWEFYIGGAVRHRLPLVMFVLPITSMYISKIKLNSIKF